jgi:hypothetical protein
MCGAPCQEKTERPPVQTSTFAPKIRRLFDRLRQAHPLRELPVLQQTLLPPRPPSIN